MIDARVGSAELDRLAECLVTPVQLGDYTLEGLISRTSTALIFVASGGAFDTHEGVLKLTGTEYAPLLERELSLLNCCQEAEVAGIVRPVRSDLEWLDFDGIPALSAAAILLPFLSGGDLVQWLAAQGSRNRQLGPYLALTVGLQVGTILRDLLNLPRPLVHGDVKLQNVLLPYPGAPLSELTVIDLDASAELPVALDDLGSAPPEIAERLVEDVHGFGELLFILATGREPLADGVADPATGQPAFDSLVVKCLGAEVEAGYVCLADKGLWHDLDTALADEQARRRRTGAARTGRLRFLFDRRALACVWVMLCVGLIVVLLSKVAIG